MEFQIGMGYKQVRFESRWKWNQVNFYTLSINKTNLKIGHFFVWTFVGSVWSFGFSSPSQRPMTSDFEGFSIPDFIHYIHFPIVILEKEPVFPFSMLSAEQGNFWYHFYSVFGMTRSLTGDWTRDLSHSKPALYH